MEPIVEAALRREGHLAAGHSDLLRQRREEGNGALFAAAGALGEPARSYIVRLFAIEELLGDLPEAPAPA
ncbi:MAG: hypothetical protein NVS9B1_06800 [Candidatus Dormibacteraceae bacterium]